MNKKKKLIFIICILCLATAAGGVTFWAKKRPPNFSKLSDRDALSYLADKKVLILKRSQFNDLVDRTEKIPMDTRFQFMRTLPAEKQDVFRRNSGFIAQARLDKTIHQFFSLPLDQRDQFLDQQIDRMAQRMGNFQGPPLNQDTASDSRAQQGNQWRRGQRNRDPNAVLQRRRDMLSSTTPEQRAERAAYFQALRQRMQQTGRMPPRRR